jgi:2-polyprenyl-6-hydroxyphenyl methylase/3-demethylubiquinone-9 3-methyltransferase
VKVDKAAALRAFDPLPLRERLFVRGRLFTAPLLEVARRAPSGRIADIGCGHGVLSSLLASDAAREVVGIDPDPRKIDWARASVGQLSNARFEVATVEQLAAKQPGSFDGAVIADVLYLLPLSQWRGFLSATRECLKPGGELLLTASEADGSWRYWKAVLQEKVMVHLLRRTLSSGGLDIQPRAEMQQILTDAGFNLRDTVSLARGYSTPHVMFVAARP